MKFWINPYIYFKHKIKINEKFNHICGTKNNMMAHNVSLNSRISCVVGIYSSIFGKYWQKWFNFMFEIYIGVIPELRLFETEKESFLGGCRYSCHFITTGFIVFVVVLLAFYWWSCIEALLCTTILIIVEHVLKSNFGCLL